MTRPLPLSAYKDCEDVYEKAMAATNPLTLNFTSPGVAVRFRQRLHKYRVLLREESLGLYPPEHPLHGRCVYDVVVCQHTPGTLQLKLLVEETRFTIEEG